MEEGILYKASTPGGKGFLLHCKINILAWAEWNRQLSNPAAAEEGVGFFF